MSTFTLTVPSSIAKYHEELEAFYIGMIHKLDLNSHKETPTREKIEGIIGLLLKEVDELQDQLNDNKFDHNSLVETFDIANFAFLTFVALCNDGVE